MELRRWPRKNDPDSIRARQEELAPRLDGEGEVFAHDLTPFARATEAITGVALVPVAVVGPIDVELGDYALEEPQGRLVERGREQEGVYVPLANTEGGLSISLYRGARAVGESGGFRTYVLKDRITRASAFLFEDVAQAVEFSRWIEAQLEEMKAWLASDPVANLSKHAKLRELETHVVGPMCHVMYAYTTGDACGMNMITRNSYALNQGFVLERAPVRPQRAMLEGNMGGDKKPSARYFERGGHGKTVVAEATLTDEAVRRVLKTSVDDLAELAFVGTHGAIASGMQSVAFTPATAIAAIFTATGQDIGMVGTSSMAHGTAHRVEGGLHVTMRLAAPRGRVRGRRDDSPLRPLLAPAHGLRRAGQGLPPGADRCRGDAFAGDLGQRGHGHRRLGELLPRSLRARRPALAVVSAALPPHHDPACWGCGDNPQGLHLPQPTELGIERYEAVVTFGDHHQAGPGIVHGGLVAGALDEAAGLLATWHRFPAVTARIFVRYRRPVFINQELALAAWVTDTRGRRIHIDADLRDGEEIVAEARCAFLHVPLDHFLATPEGRAAGEAWSRRLG